MNSYILQSVRLLIRSQKNVYYQLNIHRFYGSRSRQIFKRTNADLALTHFDGLYSNIYGRSWPSVRLALLSPKKQCAIINSFTDSDETEQKMMEMGAIDMKRYYTKHFRAYTMFKLREQIINNKKSRKRELMAKEADVDPGSINPESIEVSDVSDNELRGAQTTDASDGGFSSAEDLQAMFSDRRMDDDEKYFINRASTELSLEDYMPATEIIAREDLPNDLAYYEGFKDDLDTNIEFREEPSFDLCKELKIYSFPRNSWSRFDSPTPLGPVEIQSHYMIDGASVLAVLALDVRVGDDCADYCAAPGGKSLAALMTLKPNTLLCNDLSSSRSSKMKRIFKQYLPDIGYIRSTLRTSVEKAERMVHPDSYDKILVDVPCSNDRTSVETLDNNIFKRTRTEERLELPTKQTAILMAALKSLKPNGSVVYSTCTLSPIENDGVVQRALIQLLEEGWQSKYVVMDLREAFRPFRGLFKFNTKFKYGQQIMPSIMSNFGPMYICKIKRVS